MHSRYIFSVVCVLGLMASGAVMCEDGEGAKSGPEPTQNQAAKPSEPGKPYTAVIIDVTGFDLQRSMSPKVRRTDGTEVWGTVKVDYDYVEEHGIASYVESLDEARKNWRCGSNPVVVKAVAVYGGNKGSDPVIADDDAKLLLAENEKSHFLDKLNVIFVKGGKSAAVAKK
ncbi:MAG: hypothetical protein NT018_06795 [Armatimonadetes bacterium]|nr:hypothetical protein [Armatimonadota bacterium]